MAVINNARRSPLVRADDLLAVNLLLFGPAALIGPLGTEAGGAPLTRIVDIPLVLPTRNHGLRRELDLATSQLGLELTVVAEIDALAALKELVRDGMGATILPSGALYPDWQDPSFLSLRVVEPELSMHFTIAYSVQNPVTLGMRELARTIKGEVRRAVATGRLAGQVEG